MAVPKPSSVRRDLDGILILDKPAGITSNQALQRVKKLLRARKAGHCGSLDPLATGILPICLGQATRFSGYLLDADKTYLARCRLGQKTTTADAEGEVIEESAVSVDRSRVEAELEKGAGVRLEILPGMIPRFSVSACVVRGEGETVVYVDRIVADSRPMASYRHLLAKCFAPMVLWSGASENCSTANWFYSLQQTPHWSQATRDCQKFALAMMLPAAAVWEAAESAYRDLVHQQGWIETDQAIVAVRNRLAEQFAVPTSLVHHRLVGWPCHLYGRIAQALEAQEASLPPADWVADDGSYRQQLLFKTGG